MDASGGVNMDNETKSALRPVTVMLSDECFQFDSFEQWVNKAASWLRPIMRGYICIDSANRVCHIGKQFMRARDEGTFPVKVYLLTD